jgi:hypothetical protein
MLPDIPRHDPAKAGARLGAVFNAIRARLIAQTLISSATIKVSNTDRGQRLDKVGGGGASAALDLGFAVTHTGVAVEAAAGKVLTQSWSGATGADFKPSDWTTETNFTGTTLSSSAAAVWLQIQFTESETESEGSLGTEDVDISGGAGGRGGGGGGGGPANGDTATQYVTAGATGQDGIDGGAGGAGGGVFEISDDSPSTATGGYGADGGTGGAGGAGGDGTTASWTRKTKAVVQVRHYTISSVSAHTTKGTSSPTSAWIKLATITSGTVTQHHIGTIRLTPATLTFIEA